MTDVILTVEGALKNKAVKIFNEDILTTFTENSAVFWRCAWAMDTFTDYFKLFPDQAMTATAQGDSSPLYQEMVNQYLLPNSGNWWDDFGWAGIATLRAAESGLFDSDPTYVDYYYKIALNAFAYMYGPSWNASGTQNVPFPDVPGWSNIKPIAENVGAPNVFANAPDPYNGKPKNAWTPGVEGGIWNDLMHAGGTTPLQSPTPATYPTPMPASTYLNPLQNTVTNALFTILALRLFRAYYNNPAVKALMDGAGLIPDTIYNFWVSQMTWLNTWMAQPGNQSMKIEISKGLGALIKERAPHFKQQQNDPIQFDECYFTNMAWTGDQGLLLGALVEWHEASTLLKKLGKDTTDSWSSLPTPQKVALGVYDALYGEQDNVSDVLHPWGFFTSEGNTLDQPFGAGDDGDYRTGNATYYRYVLQALQTAGNPIPSGYGPLVTAEAVDGVINGKFPNTTNGNQPDAGYSFSPAWDGGNPAGVYTYLVNRLALVLTAVQCNVTPEE